MTINHFDQAELGQVTYNAFIFPPALNSSVSCKPVYDDTERSVMYMLYSIRIEFIVDLDHVATLGEDGTENFAYNTGGTKGTIDNQIAFLRRRLCQPGRALKIAKLGLGPDLFINTTAATTSPQPTLWDVTWGPKPRMISWEPLGMNRAVRVTWECDVGLVECENTGSSWKEARIMDSIVPHTHAVGIIPANILQICYNQSWTIDTTGATTKNYEAVIETRGQMNNNDIRLVMDSSDHYRIYFEPAVEAGFLRTRNYKLDKAKTRLEITITDTEVPSDWAYPPGVVDIDVQYSISSSLTGSNPVGGGMSGFHVWQASMSGSFTLAKGFHPYWRRIYPYYLALLLIRTRYDAASAGAAGGNWRIRVDAATVAGDDPPDPEFSIPLEFELSENMFGREFSFSFTWMMVKAPENAPAAFNFGGAGNIYAEEQLGVLQDPRLTSGQLWTWDLWVDSVYGTGNDTTAWDFNWGAHLTIKWKEVVGARSRYPVTKFKKITLPCLGSWYDHGPAFSNRGSYGGSFQGDSRQEPCQPNKDFWYSRVPRGMSASGFTPSIALTSQLDETWTTMTFIQDYEIHEETGAMTHHQTSTGARPIGLVQDGAGLGVSPAIKRPITQRGQHSNMGLTFNPTNDHIAPNSSIAASVQVTSAVSTYKVRIYGYRVDLGKAGPVPEQTKLGEGELVLISSRSNKTTLQPLGDTAVYKVMWERWYHVIGSPRSIANALNADPTIVKESSGTSMAVRTG